MSLKTEDGHSPQPLEQLTRNAADQKEKTENALLKEALAISNEKCNSLIEQLSLQVKDLSDEVKYLQGVTQRGLELTMQRATEERNETEKLIAEERRLNARIASEARETMTEAVRKAEDKVVGISEKELREPLRATKGLINRTRETMNDFLRDLRDRTRTEKFLMWASPILSLGSIVILLVDMLI